MKIAEENRYLLISYITEASGLTSLQVEHTVELLLEGATVPFIARYRKEYTGELDEVQIRAVEDHLAYFIELDNGKSRISYV